MRRSLASSVIKVRVMTDELGCNGAVLRFCHKQRMRSRRTNWKYFRSLIIIQLFSIVGSFSLAPE